MLLLHMCGGQSAAKLVEWRESRREGSETSG